MANNGFKKEDIISTLQEFLSSNKDISLREIVDDKIYMEDCMEKKNKFLIILTFILFVLVICLGGYVVYDKVFSENKKGDTTDKNENNNDEVDFDGN